MSIIGTELKINVNVEPIGNVHLADCDFECLFYIKGQVPTASGVASTKRGTKSVLVRKEEMLRVDDDNYVALVDSSLLGVGNVMMTIKVYVPDTDFDDGFRTEVDSVWTGVTIKPV